MLSNVGHTIQKMINNTPIAITVNETHNFCCNKWW